MDIIPYKQVLTVIIVVLKWISIYTESIIAYVKEKLFRFFLVIKSSPLLSSLYTCSDKLKDLLLYVFVDINL